MSIIVLSPNVSVESAKSLAEALKAKYENPYETRNRDFTKYDVVVKYGFSRPIKTKKGALVVNKTKSVEIAIDKIKTLSLFKEDGFTVPFAITKAEAKKFLDKKGSVVARLDATASNGIGIVYCDTEEELKKVTEAKFYTKYIKSTNEFRVNVWRDKVVSVYDKVVPNEHFRFKLFQGVEEHPQLVAMAKAIYEKTGLDFYGLDVLRDRKGTLHLLEINSSPVLFPYTLNKLTTIIKKEAGK